jgi:hypothetical protein
MEDIEKRTQYPRPNRTRTSRYAPVHKNTNFFYFLHIFSIPLYFRAVHVHSANGVNLKKRHEEECSVAHLHINRFKAAFIL